MSSKSVKIQETSDISKAAENEIKNRVIKIEKNLKYEVKDRREIISDLIRRYKQKQEQLLERNKDLVIAVDRLKENIGNFTYQQKKRKP